MHLEQIRSPQNLPQGPPGYQLRDYSSIRGLDAGCHVQTYVRMSQASEHLHLVYKGFEEGCGEIGLAYCRQHLEGGVEQRRCRCRCRVG